MTRSNRILVFLSLAALGCGGGDPDTETTEAVDTPPPVAERAEQPELPMDSVGFQAIGEADGLTGSLWLSTSQPGGADGVSLIAQLEGVPEEQAYSWALHRGGCDAPDDMVLALGYGTEATDDGVGRSESGGPLGESRAAFEPTLDGRVEETVWVPLDGRLSRQELESTPHSLRIHRETGADEPGPAVACAPIPDIPDPDRDPAGT